MRNYWLELGPPFRTDEKNFKLFASLKKYILKSERYSIRRFETVRQSVLDETYRICLDLELILHDLTCDTLHHVVEIPTRPMHQLGKCEVNAPRLE